jgi:enamine deaminase RidA (YjgF/YER057c/UK114 family)
LEENWMTISGLKDCATTLQLEPGSGKEGRTAWSIIRGCDATTLYVCVRPVASDQQDRQIRELYDTLDGLLQELGAERRHVITEKVHFADIAAGVEALRAVRENYYTGGNGHAGSLPATTYIQQPPAEPGVLFELQALVMVPVDGEELTVRDVQGLPAPASGKVVSSRGYDHVFMQNLTGGRVGDGLSYAEQTADMFQLAARALEQEQLTFRDVVRTWIYVDELERDYADLNRVRSAFFQQHGVERLPASTGIQGGVYPLDRGGLLDLYALRTERDVDIRLMHAGTLNEAWCYGSAFARGMAVTREDRTVLYVSGTASIDTTGTVVHVGDTAGQVERMLLNVRELLAGSGAAPADMVRATTYLKDAADYEVFKRVYAEQGFPLDVPHTICAADVCRPEWLVEIEVEAVIPLK